MSLTIGPYHVGEIPPQLTVTFRDQAGNAINLSGYSAKFSYRSYGGMWVTLAATVDGDQVNNKGQVHYAWVAADMTAAGDYEGEVWVGNNGPQRYDSIRLRWQVLPAVIPVPTI